MRTARVSDRDWLLAAFAVPGTTARSVAVECGCDERTVRRWMTRLGVVGRPAAEVASMRQAEAGALPALTREVLDGELLGDGCLSVRTRGVAYAARYRHRTRSHDYLTWLATRLDGLTCSVRGPYENVAPDGKRHAVYELTSRSHGALGVLHGRWYDADGRKRVPLDLVLTPTVALHWYLGDGGVETGRGRRPVVGLATHGFTRAEVDRLAEQLEACRPRVHRHYDWWRLRLDADPFLDFIGPCPVAVHERKWLAHR